MYHKVEPAFADGLNQPGRSERTLKSSSVPLSGEHPEDIGENRAGSGPPCLYGTVVDDEKGREPAPREGRQTFRVVASGKARQVEEGGEASVLPSGQTVVAEHEGIAQAIDALRAVDSHRRPGKDQQVVAVATEFATTEATGTDEGRAIPLAGRDLGEPEGAPAAMFRLDFQQHRPAAQDRPAQSQEQPATEDRQALDVEAVLLARQRRGRALAAVFAGTARRNGPRCASRRSASIRTLPPWPARRRASNGSPLRVRCGPDFAGTPSISGTRPSRY